MRKRRRSEAVCSLTGQIIVHVRSAVRGSVNSPILCHHLVQTQLDWLDTLKMIMITQLCNPFILPYSKSARGCWPDGVMGQPFEGTAKEADW